MSKHRKESYVSGSGTVESMKKDKTEGHDEIVVRLKDGRRIVISNNTELGIRIEPAAGDQLGFHGFQVDGTNVVHKVHPNKRQRGGWLEFAKAANDKTTPAYSLKDNPTYDDVEKVFKQLSFEDRANITPKHPDFIRKVPDDMLFDRQVVVDEEGNPVGFNEFYAGRNKLGRRQPPHNAMAVLPDARGNGLSRLMVEAAIRKARKEKIKRLVWEAFADNESSIRAALSAGFEDRTPKSAKGYRRFVYKVQPDQNAARRGKRLYHQEKKAAVSRDELVEMARKHYPEVNSHGWNHIEDVLARAERMRRRRLLKKELAAILYHDSSLMNGSRETHDVDSAAIAGRELKGKFHKQQLDDIVNAIAHHRASYTGARGSRLEDLVSAADRDEPEEDISKYIMRSYQYGLEHGMTPDEAIDNTYHHMPDKYGTRGYAYKNIPKLYMDTYGDVVRKSQKAFDRVTPEQIRALVGSE